MSPFQLRLLRVKKMKTKWTFRLLIVGLLLTSIYAHTENDIDYLLMNFDKDPQLEGWIVSHSFLDSRISLDTVKTESEMPILWLTDEQSVRVQDRKSVV